MMMKNIVQSYCRTHIYEFIYEFIMNSSMNSSHWIHDSDSEIIYEFILGKPLHQAPRGLPGQMDENGHLNTEQRELQAAEEVL